MNIKCLSFAIVGLTGGFWSFSEKTPFWRHAPTQIADKQPDAVGWMDVID